ncbi:MAG: hypothetical protein AABX33_08195 [Nanoarchaeota archaeon]
MAGLLGNQKPYGGYAISRHEAGIVRSTKSKFALAYLDWLAQQNGKLEKLPTN